MSYSPALCSGFSLSVIVCFQFISFHMNLGTVPNNWRLFGLDVYICQTPFSPLTVRGIILVSGNLGLTDHQPDGTLHTDYLFLYSPVLLLEDSTSWHILLLWNLLCVFMTYNYILLLHVYNASWMYVVKLWKFTKQRKPKLKQNRILLALDRTIVVGKTSVYSVSEM